MESIKQQTISLAAVKQLKKYFRFLSLTLTLIGILHVAPDLGAYVIEDKGRGFNAITDETLQHVEENWDAIIEVKPNKIGLERMRNHRESNELPPLFLAPVSQSDEFVLVTGQNKATIIESNTIKSSLPSKVDNSQLPSFPPIGDQKQLGSCVAWGTTYYQATHEYGLLNGINNKTSLKYVFSPKWTYNNLNGGVDQGLTIFETYQLFAQNGLVSIDRLPYDDNFRSWDLNPQDWIDAISFRTSPGQLIAGIGGEKQNLQVIKQLLNNGHILTFGTFIDSWNWAKVKKDPASSENTHVGEIAASWMKGTFGGHCMTIVGYDDDIWIDVNNNGQVDPGEKGAFLIANSWGPDWGNKGFVWIAYDAFLTKSAVAGGPWLNRVAIAAAMGSYVVSAVPISRQYSPKMIAKFSISQTTRDQISVAVGISDVHSTKPSKVFNSYAVFNQGGGLEFDGTLPQTLQTATFALDLTDLLSAASEAAKRFYLLVGDNKSGNPTIIESFEVVDINKHKTQNYVDLPLTLDCANHAIYLDYNPDSTIPTPHTPPVPVPQPPAISAPTLAITSPINNQSVGIYTWLTAVARDSTGIDRVEFYIDSVLHTTDSSAPYYVLLPTKGLSHGSHELTVIAYNRKGASTTKTIHFNVAHK